MIKFPDYDKSILSVASSVLKHFGVTDCPHKSLDEFDSVLSKNYKNIIVMLFDGLGVDAINYHLSEDSFLRSHFVCPISSVFPPTTTAATTTIQSGYSPIEHGWLGWDLYFKEIDENVSIFRNTLQRTGEKAADYYLSGKIIPVNTVFDRIKKADKKAKAYYLSPFSNPSADSLDDIEKYVKRLSRHRGKKYIYVYNPQPDSDMHKFGVYSKEVHDRITQINAFAERLCNKLSDSVIVITADHGLIDSKIEFLQDYPVIWDMLKRPASMEPRALSLYVKDGCKEKFKEEFNKAFADKFLLLTKQEVYDKKLFGNGTPHPRADGFIGDYLAVGISDLTLANFKDEFNFIGVHAGLDEREITVPFILIER